MNKHLEDRIKINVSVGGRNYPLKVTSSEEEHVRKAVDFIEKRMSVIEEKYAIKDIQDIQALILIEIASELSFLKKIVDKENQIIIDKINDMIQL